MLHGTEKIWRGFITFASKPSDKNVAKYSNRYSSWERIPSLHPKWSSCRCLLLSTHKYMCKTPYASQQEGNHSWVRAHPEALTHPCASSLEPPFSPLFPVFYLSFLPTAFTSCEVSASSFPPPNLFFFPRTYLASTGKQNTGINVILYLYFSLCPSPHAAFLG